MKKFSLEEYLKNPERKVVTGSGSEAAIIFTKANKEWPVVALINDSVESGMAWQFSENGESMPDNDGSIYYGGLFFADEEEPLTEFEKALKELCITTRDWNNTWETPALRQNANHLLELAKKQLDSEYDGKAMLYLAEKQYERGKEDGKAEAIKDLPKWKKTKPERGIAFGCGPWIPSGINWEGDKHGVFINGYEISVDELFEKLPKEEEV